MSVADLFTDLWADRPAELEVFTAMQALAEPPSTHGERGWLWKMVTLDEILSRVHPERGVLAPLVHTVPTWPVTAVELRQDAWWARLVQELADDPDLASVVQDWWDTGDLLGDRHPEVRLIWQRGTRPGAHKGEPVDQPPPGELWMLFPSVRVVSRRPVADGPEVVLEVPGVRDLPSREIGPETLLLGASPLIDALCDLDTRGTSPRGYRLRPSTSFTTSKASTRRAEIADAACGASVDLVVLPEGVGDHLGEGWWPTRRHRARPRFHWVIPGSTIADPPQRPFNEARWFARRSAPAAGAPIARHRKLAPYQIMDPGRYGLTQTGPVTEDIATGNAIEILETPNGRLAVLICEDLGALERTLAPLAAYGPTHVIVLVFDEELERSRWYSNAAGLVTSRADARVIVVNSTAVARRAGDKASPEPVAAALWTDAKTTRTAVNLASARRPTDLLVPQYGDFGSPLRHDDLQPGDLLLFVRGDPTVSIGPLTALIAQQDGTDLTHAAVVIDSTTGVPVVADAGGTMRRGPLDRLAGYAAADDGGAPLLVMRPTFACVDGFVGAIEALVMSSAPYPGFDLLLGAVLQRASMADIDEAARDRLRAHLLSLSAAFGGDGWMCAALVARALQLSRVALDDGPDPTRLHRVSFGRLWLRYFADTGFVPDADTIATAVETGFTGLAELAATLPPATPANIVAFLAGGSPTGSHGGLRPFIEYLLGPVTPDETKGWAAAIGALGPPGPVASKHRHRLVTVGQLAHSSAFAPLGHMHQWWTGPAQSTAAAAVPEARLKPKSGTHFRI